jgi:UTP--glucose-1-phosphate uridylyltransferase
MKAVILTAGLGSRFLPMTKAVPKAMLPIVNKPVIQYLVEEALAAGITEIIMVNGAGSEVIERHFRHNHELAADLKSRGKEDLLKPIEELEAQVKIATVVQDEARGDGHAILCAKHLLQGEPFAVLFGDDIVDVDPPALVQLKKLYDTEQKAVIATQRVPEDEVSHYGIIDPGSITERRIEVKGLVEKPAQEEAPSNIGVIGKYICPPETLDYLAKAEASHASEIRLLDGFRAMLADQKEILAYDCPGTRYDTGRPEGLLQANLAYGKKMGLI